MVKRIFRKRPPNSGSKWKCPVCHKTAYSTWRYAAWDADQLVRKGHRRERPYWSRRCGAFHVGSLPKRRNDP